MDEETREFLEGELKDYLKYARKEFHDADEMLRQKHQEGARWKNRDIKRIYGYYQKHSYEATKIAFKLEGNYVKALDRVNAVVRAPMNEEEKISNIWKFSKKEQA